MVQVFENMTAIFYFACFFCGALGAWLIARFAVSLGLVDVPNDRSSHRMPTPKGGGVGLLFVFVSGSLIAGLPLLVWLPLTGLALLSLLDDRLELSAKVRLLVQISAVSLALYATGESGEIVSPLFLFWVLFMVGTANFYNFMDGINGIAGITGTIAFCFLGWFASGKGQADMAVVCLGVAFCCAGFLPFNVPRARVFMGDVGSILLGALFGYMVVRLSSTFQDFLVSVSFLAPFYLDALTTLWVRWREGEKLTEAHRRHVYQILANQGAYPHWQVACAYGCAQAVCGVLMLCSTYYVSPLLTYCTAFFLVVVIFMLKSKVRRVELKGRGN